MRYYYAFIHSSDIVSTIAVTSTGHLTARRALARPTPIGRPAASNHPSCWSVHVVLLFISCVSAPSVSMCAVVSLHACVHEFPSVCHIKLKIMVATPITTHTRAHPRTITTMASQECSGQGHCDRSTGQCVCQAPFVGAACEASGCPSVNKEVGAHNTNTFCCEQLRDCGAERAVVVHTCMFEWGVVCCGEPVILVGSSILDIRIVIMWLGKNQFASQSVSQPVSHLVS